MKKLAAAVVLAFIVAVGLAAGEQQTITTNGQALAVQCDQNVAINITSATTTQVVAPIVGKQVFVCGYVLNVNGSAAAQQILTFQFGTGVTCGTGTTSISGPMRGNPVDNTPLQIFDTIGIGTSFRTPISNALCILSATATAVGGHLSFAQF